MRRELKRGRGRPMKEPTDLITIDQAVDAIKEHLTKKFGPEVASRMGYAKGTIYNMTSAGALHTWHHGRYAFVSKAEVLGLTKLVG